MTATFSPDRRYRYDLTREVAPLTGEGTVVFIGLNPSTADETQNDPTIRRCIGFAERWGFAKLVMLNLYAYRSTDPRALLTVPDPVGPENDQTIRSWVLHRFDKERPGLPKVAVVAAWGQIAQRARVTDVLRLIIEPWCLGFTKGGHPRHPLYVKGDTPLVPYYSRRDRG